MNIEETVKLRKKKCGKLGIEHDTCIVGTKELDNLLKVIDMMADQIRSSDIDEDICKLITEPIECYIKNGECKNCIKEYFYKKAEDK